MALKEKDIAKHLKDNWNTYFPDLVGCKLEVPIRNSRVDILSSYPVDLYELGLKKEDDILRYANAAVFVEIKYNSNMRDLLYELQKHINFRNWYVNFGKAWCFIMVISDEFDYEMVKFMEDNNIIMYKYSIEDEDLSTFKIEEYNMRNIELEEANDIICC